MLTNLKKPDHAIQLLCKSVAVFALIPYRIDKMESSQVKAFNRALEQFNLLAEMLARDSYQLDRYKSEVLLLDTAINDLRDKWLKSERLSETSKAAVRDFIKSLEHLRRSLHGGWSEKMFHILEGDAKQCRAQKFSDFKEFYINITCEDCPATSRGLALVYEDIHVPDLIEITGEDHVWGRYKFTCPANRKHKVRPSMHSGKGRMEKPLGLILGKPFKDYLRKERKMNGKGNIEHGNANRP